MSPKRLHLITTAFTLFYQKGVHAVGINEILAESGVAKKTLYHHFSSKDDLVLAVLEYRDECFRNWLQARLEAAPLGIEKIDALFDALDDWFNDRVDVLLPFHGCFFINVSGEYSELEHPLHQQCSRHKQLVVELITNQVESFITDSDTVVQISNALSLLKEGAITVAYVQGDRSAALKAKQTARALIAAL
ncbi:TetR/AcrR family transcriptional regulator [Pontibacterium sp.]|uniref:TetR/AcrR family transcriptional regulator n=1 Tax=Pontibacterium sp. TaxID=2036026 RepID=UPI0035145370